MDTDTGEILGMDEVLKKPIKEQKMFMELSEEEYQEVLPMNRHERRKWAKLHKGRD